MKIIKSIKDVEGLKEGEQYCIDFGGPENIATYFEIESAIQNKSIIDIVNLNENNVVKKLVKIAKKKLLK